MVKKVLSIYVSHASDCLTDHLPHGEGLLSFSWLKSLADRGHKVYAYSPGADIKKAVPNLSVFTGRRRGPFKSLAYWEHAFQSGRILRSLVAEKEIDLVWRMYPYLATVPFVNTYKKPLFIGPLYSSFNKENILPSRSFSGFSPSGLGTYFGRKGWGEVLRKADGLFTDDLKLAAELNELFPGKMVTQVSAIVNPPHKIERRAIPDFKKGISLAFVNHFHPSKRLKDFCRIVALLREKGYPVKGVVVGQGEDLQNVLLYCRENKLEDHIMFLGTLPNRQVFDQLLQAHFLLNLRQETYGRNMVEAMSVGTPNICVNRLAATEFMEQGKSGILLDNISPESYAQAVEEVIHKPDYWKELSDNSIASSQEWTEDKIALKLEQSFISLLRNSRHA